MPSQSAFYSWLRDKEELEQKYVRAREAQADVIFDEVLDIADGGGSDENVQRDRLRIDARKWMAGKLAPRRYGDKVKHEHGVDEGLASMMKTLESGRGRASKRAKPES